MANEPIDKQLQQAEPEGVAGRWASRVFSKKGMTVAVVVFGFFLMMRSTKPQGPVSAANTKPAQTIVDAPVVPPPTLPPPPKQTVVADTGTQPTGAAIAPGSPSQTQPEDPIKALQEDRRQRLVKAAFASDLLLDKGAEPPLHTTAPGTPATAAVNQSPQSLPSLYVIPEGTIAEAVLDSRLEGEMTGPVDAHVSTDVYLPGTRTLVLPQGSKLLGEANKVGSFGQQRLAVTFHKAQIFANGGFCSVDLAHDPGLDQQGAMGLTGKVNNHLLSLLLATSAVGILQGASLGFAYNQGGYSSAASIMQGITGGGTQAVEKMLEPFVNRVPRITVYEGTRIKLRFIRDTPSSCEVSQ